MMHFGRRQEQRAMPEMSGSDMDCEADPAEITEGLATIEAWRFKALSAYLERGDQ
jgi:hypothetical protein